MPGTPNRVSDHQPFLKRTAVVRARGTNRKEFVATAREQHGVLANMAAQHRPVGDRVSQDAEREIRSGCFGRGGGHGDLRFGTLMSS